MPLHLSAFLSGATKAVDKRARHDICTMEEFMLMSSDAKRRLPHLQPPQPRVLCIRNASDVELVHLVHLERKTKAMSLGFGNALTCHQAICLYLAASHRDLSQSRIAELEEIAKLEDTRAMLTQCDGLSMHT